MFLLLTVFLTLKPNETIMKQTLIKWILGPVLLAFLGATSPFVTWADNHEEIPLSEINWDESEEPSLSDMNWDDEPEGTTNNNSEAVDEGALSGINWDEGADETSEATSVVMEQKAPAPLPLTAEEKDPFYHWKGGALFLLYLFGAFFTGHFTRKLGITQRLAPEFLILLHTFWPLEWLLIPFFKNPSNLATE